MTEADEVWRTDPATLRDVILDSNAVESPLEDCPQLDFVVAGPARKSLEGGDELLENSGDRFKPLLALAHAYQCQYWWGEAARLQEEALRLAVTRPKEALVRHHIGRRLFDQARYWDATAEFEWASDLYRAAGRAWAQFMTSPR